jgi:protein SCO1/2
MKRLAFLILGIALGLGVLFLTIWIIDQNYQYKGSLIEPPVAAPEISLVNQDGALWNLGDQKGKVSVIFFGYTSCPDVCPTTLSIFRQIKLLLDQENKLVNFVYITVDPERDTSQKMKNNLAAFDPGFIGLTGTNADLEPVWKGYGVYREKVPTESATGYLMDHSAITYVIDKQGNLKLTYPYGMDAREISEDLKHLLKEE